MTEQNGSASPILSAASTTKKRKRPTTRGPLKIGRPGKEKLRALSETIGNIVYVPVGELREAEYNPNVMSDAEIKRLASSLKQYGFVDPIIANLRTRTIVGGHVSVLGSPQDGFEGHYRIHHEVQYRYCSPCILRETHRKATAGQRRKTNGKKKATA